jgi:polysaccharide biosynthesis transport protein
MRQAIELRSREGPADLVEFPGLPAAEGHETPFQKIHRLLRGRYIWAILLGLALGAAGGYGGYRAASPVYGCNGMIHIKPVLSPVLRQIPENGLMPMYQSYVNAQGALIRSQRVIDMAMQSEDWRRIGRPVSDEQVRDFQQSLIVNPAPGSETITVSFRDREMAATAAAVRSILLAYDRIYVEGEIEAEENRRRVLEDRRLALSNEVKLKRDSIQQAAREFGTDDLRPLHQMKLEMVGKLESALADVDHALAAVEPRDEQQAAAPAPELSVAAIAMRDNRMWQMVSELRRLESDLELRRQEFGERHQKVQELRAAIGHRQREVDTYAEGYRQLAAAGGAGGGGELAGVDVGQLKQRQARYRELFDAGRQETLRVGRSMLDIEKLRREEADVLRRLEETQRRIDELSVESFQGRIRIVSMGDRPTVVKDPRKQLAAMGLMLGSCLGVGLIMLIGLMDHRLRSPEDAGLGGQIPLLGILPSLPDDLADPEQAAMAAHCVHRVRTLLQINSAPLGHRIFAITSPVAGTGKTSLALGLGISFAASNARTLMIDCDVLGGGLTARVDAIVRRKIGQILCRQGLVTDQQLEAALHFARSSRRRLGEVLVELGHLSQSDMERALAQQHRTRVGLLDVLAGESLDDCTADTGIAGLSILPLGAATPDDISRVAPAALRRVLDQVRERYDVVLLDTGPVPGSLEASVLSAAVDGVVMVVSRGEDRPAAERSIQHLLRIGARISGIVFNRAMQRDVEIFSSDQRTNSVSRREEQAHQEAGSSNGRGRYGPLASGLATHRNGNGTGDPTGNGNGEH